MDPSIETSIQYDIRTAVSTYEERANLLGVTVDGDPDSNNLKINIVFSTINSEAPASLTLTLEAIR
jgi:phage baseplate assembly protein W